jgi:hypothetical protein
MPFYQESNKADFKLNQLKRIFYRSINITGKPPKEPEHYQLFTIGLRKTGWTLLQILADHPHPHPHPQKILFIGASFGGDIIGAAQIDTDITVIDSNQKFLKGVKRLCPEVECINGNPSNFSVVSQFDIIIFSIWWLIEVNNMIILKNESRVLHGLTTSGRLFNY